MKITKSLLLRFGNDICRKHGKALNQKIRVPVFLETGEWLNQKDCWFWLARAYAQANGLPIPVADKKAKPGKPYRATPVRKKKEAKPYVREHRESHGAMPSAAFYASSEWRAVRFDALKKSDGCCELCGHSKRVHGVVLHVDHIQPRSKRPDLALAASNLQVLCEACNLGKSNRDDTDWRQGQNVVWLDKVDWRRF